MTMDLFLYAYVFFFPLSPTKLVLDYIQDFTIPVGPCISWVNDYTNEYWYRVKNNEFQGVYSVDCDVYWKTFMKFPIIVDILLTFHMRRRHLTGNEAVGMHQARQVQRAVAGHFNVSQSVIARLWNWFQHTGNVAERPRSGRPRKTTVRQDRYLSDMAKRQLIQLICVPTDQQFVPYWPWDTEQRVCSVQETMWNWQLSHVSV
jgi:transposase